MSWTSIRHSFIQYPEWQECCQVELAVLGYIIIAFVFVFIGCPYEGICVSATKENLIVKSIKVLTSSSYYVDVYFYRNQETNSTCEYISRVFYTKSSANKEANKFSVGEYHTVYVSKSDKSTCYSSTYSHELFIIGLVMILAMGLCLFMGFSYWYLVHERRTHLQEIEVTEVEEAINQATQNIENENEIMNSEETKMV
jgi:hypothetical protein